MNDVDPLTGHIENLEASLTHGASASMAGDIASIDVGLDGSIRAIRLTDYGRRLDPDTLVEAIVRLHATALRQARNSVADAVARLENDPRLLALRERVTDAFNQQPHQQATPTPRRDPTPEEEIDPYYQRKTWLEY
ncbi:hypothetical protein IU500_13405 [Nocardia terpenica]|uniref:hypothetical protein n=1 Tax=Nocardia terpenica TaxID=455432 RepID=UPI0018950C1A|nr:hypothetical protein [Nocardia terpenica]MBF6062826.1 hypothetical protein [Nocardia terpenica]MBF6105039.1 hypothetical protein [Nocardia terpenica]MBF6112524.1 hypothetical protein [Nocardia terpenica]MBF6118767.1 hypothetical protein [Nocardia terpenica]MBF6154236.1 hypothetical protein [Nocardia terpenica]